MPHRKILMLALLLPGLALAADDCPPFNNTITGGDYTNPEHRSRLDVVERFHFTPQVERLERGQSGYIGGDIGYTLEHFPNHHRALTSLSRLALREKSSRPKGSKYTIECYFDRAIRYRPDDARVRAIFGSYLLALGQQDAALAQLEEAARLEPRNATNQYNLGLVYVLKQDYPKAREAAKLAYELGFPLPGLKNKLVAAGQWQN
ncbi:TPR repeat protein [Pseudoduganella flava]|uniref:TPR repeat protein n=1 Tax=Pseudoduganella flava TaxID=871742 RepID=A0A562PQK6_9BURK|nr:tetratricopeptide repeat protein [Pseudoduganella flava]QGZ37811.1 tetratricopeptide repeat protein [Pseudoduganella flava]TWI46633.1 TPR repeat protein [Pseudoduganella flava]